MARDLVSPMKWERADTGGTENDLMPEPLNPGEDYVKARGLVLQKNTGPGEWDNTQDETVGLEREAVDDTLRFWDDENPTPVKLTDLLAGTGGLTSDGHKILRQLIHFIEDGPAEGFASGAYREITGAVFPTAITWWESSSKSKKIVEKMITWTGAKPTTIVWKVYDTDGSTVLATVTDTITYSGPFEANRTRAIV